MVEEDVLTYEEAARLLRVSERTLERWVAEKQVPYVRLPRRGSWASVRFLRSQLVRWLEKRSEKPVGWRGRMSPPWEKEV
jgi:excisionase family DNA binding protein